MNLYTIEYGIRVLVIRLCNSPYYIIQLFGLLRMNFCLYIMYFFVYF